MPQRADTLNFKPQVLEDWLADVEKDKAPRWLIRDFIAADSLTLLSGPPKKLGKKTLLAMAQSLLLAAGRSYQGLEVVQPTPVLYCYHEAARQATRDRFAMLARGLQLDLAGLQRRFWFSHRSLVDLRNKAEVAEIGSWCRDNAIGLVVFDTLAKSMSGDEDDAENMGRVVRGVESARSYGTSVLILHHVTKAGANLSGGSVDPDKDLRGSGALAGAYETHQAVRQYSYNVKKHDLLVQNKDGGEFAHKIWWDFDNGAATLQMGPRTAWDNIHMLDADDVTDLMSSVSIGNTYTPDMLAAMWKVSKPTSQELTAKLIAQGQLESVKYGYRIPE